MEKIRRKYRRINPPYSPDHNPWNIPDWREVSEYEKPKNKSRALWRWEFLRRSENCRKDWQKYVQLLSERNTAGKGNDGKCRSSSDDPFSGFEIEFMETKYWGPVKAKALVHPRERNPPAFPERSETRKELPIELVRGMLAFPDPETGGLTDVYDPTEWDPRGEYWGLHYTLFPQEVVLRFDLRFTNAEQLCSKAVKEFPQRIFSSPNPQPWVSPRPRSSTCTIAPGQTVPDLGWPKSPTGKPPITVPRFILDPGTSGIVHVIFDLTQPKGPQWQSAKKELKAIQKDYFGNIKKLKADPSAWLTYLRILDAYDYNPDPDKLKVTQQKIGELVLGISIDSPAGAETARAQVSQMHTTAEELLIHFPY